jgi:hypothetical protein
MIENKTTKLSLYFKKETMNELIRMKDLLILTGLPSNELPDMNEFIDTIISYVKNVITVYPAERERLEEYSRGIIRRTTREIEDEKIETDQEETEEEKEKTNTNKEEIETGTARFLYRITQEEKDNLNRIRNLTKMEMTDPMLIRTITEYSLIEKIDKRTILHLTFIATMYKITPKIIIELLYNRENVEKEYLKNINEKDKQQLRKIAWDHGIFEAFKKIVEKEKHTMLTFKSGKFTGGRLFWIFGIKPETYNESIEKTNSRVNEFNYMIAYAGLSMINGMIENNIKTITEGIININKTNQHTAKKTIETIEELIKISDKINNNPEM